MSDDDCIVPTELDSPSDGDDVLQASASSDVVAAQDPSIVPPGTLDQIIDGDTDPYGFLQREEEERKRPKRSRTPTRSEVIAAMPKIVLGSTGDDPAACSSGSSHTHGQAVWETWRKQTVCLQVLPLSMQRHADRQASFVPHLIYANLDKMGKVAYHLEDKFPGRSWKTYIPQVSQFGKFCNTLDELKQHEARCQSSFKYGATVCLTRRWWSLGLHRSYSHLFYYITDSVHHSKSLETALIANVKSSNDESRRLRCENTLDGGEGLGQDREGNSYLSGHFVYLAVARHR